MQGTYTQSTQNASKMMIGQDKSLNDSSENIHSDDKNNNDHNNNNKHNDNDDRFSRQATVVDTQVVSLTLSMHT